MKGEIRKYDEYLKNKLEAQLDYLPVNLENEGVEHLKMAYAKSIDQYPFLHGIIKKVLWFSNQLTKIYNLP